MKQCVKSVSYTHLDVYKRQVYRGLKTADKGGLQFSCVLKFKPKYVYVNGTKIDRVKVFKDEELKIFENLQECRSIVRIYDVIESLGDFSLPCDKIKSGVINASGYFCVVEEYIDGWSLEEYCRQERWKLRKIEQLENNLSKVVDYHEYTEDEKSFVNLSYYKNYDNVLKYQSEIFQFMINLCEILEFVTEKKNIPVSYTHLDVYKRQDLYEKADGPHMLVAGTTGSGKSETIITYLIGLCMKFSPMDLNLMLVDMKGGGFSDRLGDLPHCVGVVTDTAGEDEGTSAASVSYTHLDVYKRQI